MLTTAQKEALKTNIQANSDTNQLYIDGNLSGLADLYNAPASPAFWVRRTNVSRQEIYNNVSADGTSWDWTIYKGQGVAEQNAWTQMFMGDQADFSKPNLLAGIGKIFGISNVNTLHSLAIGRRQATRLEKLLSTGPGTTATPATMFFEGTIDYAEFINL